MDGGGLLIISHSQKRSRTGKGAPIGVMVNFYSFTIKCVKELKKSFAPGLGPLVIHRRTGENTE